MKLPFTFHDITAPIAITSIVVTLVVGIGIICVLFIKEPDLLDAFIELIEAYAEQVRREQ